MVVSAFSEALNHHKNNLQKNATPMAQSNIKDLHSSEILFHSIGYGLLLFMSLDFVDLIFPLHFMDPVWEFKTIGALVERVSLPLIGLVLIFYKEADFRAKWELKLLKLLSHASLLLGIFFLLLIFLCVSNTFRINKINDDNVNAQTTQQLSQLQQTEQRVNKATDSEIAGFIAQFSPQGVSPNAQNSQELRSRLLSELDKSKNKVKVEAETIRRTRRLALIKNSVKWTLGSLIAGDLFIRVWQATRWARKSTKRN